MVGGFGVVGDHHDGLAHVGVEAAHEAQDLLRVLRIQSPRGLIGHQDVGVRDDGPRDGHPLFLAATQLPGIVPLLVREVHQGQRLRYPLPAGAAAQAREQQGQLDVLEGREHRHQVVVLEDEPHVGIPPGRQLVVVQVVQLVAADLQSAAGGPVDARH